MEEGLGAEPSPAGARPKKKNRKAYDLTAADRFWQKHKGRCANVFMACSWRAHGVLMTCLVLAAVFA